MLNKVEIHYFKNYLMRNLIKSVIVKEYKITKYNIITRKQNDN